MYSTAPTIIPTTTQTPKLGTRRLFDIGADLQAWHNLLDETGGDISDPAVAAAIEAWFAEVARDEAVKLDGYCNLIKLLDSEAAVARAEAEEYAKRAQVRENRVKWLKNRMKDYLTATGRTKAQTATGRTVAVQKNGGKLPLAIDAAATPETVPVEYVRVVQSINTEAVRAALEAGQELAFAKLMPADYHLRIR